MPGFRGRAGMAAPDGTACSDLDRGSEGNVDEIETRQASHGPQHRPPNTRRSSAPTAFARRLPLGYSLSFVLTVCKGRH